MYRVEAPKRAYCRARVAHHLAAPQPGGASFSGRGGGDGGRNRYADFFRGRVWTGVIP